MTRLFDPSRHEALAGPRWDEGRAREAIEQIVAGTEAAFDADDYWPLHPRDIEPGDDPSQPATPLYHGACGAVWALEYLAAMGFGEPTYDRTSMLETLLQRNRHALGAACEEGHRSYLCGDTPIRLLQHRAAPSAERAAELAGLIEGNLDHPSRELMWGAPGTLLAALFLYERTNDPAWAALFRACADRLFRDLEWSESAGCSFWTQHMYGYRSRYLGAVHGFAGSVLPLIRGRSLLGAQWPRWAACIATTIERTALREGRLANWPAELQPGYEDKRLLQLCHGAPGIVVALAKWPEPSLGELLLAAGETTWAAGPLVKGAGLCHGTAGNGYAFLALFARSRDAMWLERARAFAMHAILQSEADLARHGQRRFSLWTGDLGLALYLWDCIEGKARFPTLDVFDPPRQQGPPRAFVEPGASP